MTTEAASLALAQERRDLDMEEQQLIEDAWGNEPFEPYVNPDCLHPGSTDPGCGWYGAGCTTLACHHMPDDMEES